MPDIWATVLGPAYDAAKAGRAVDVSAVWDDGKRLRAAHGNVHATAEFRDGSINVAGLSGTLNQVVSMYPSNFTELPIRIETGFYYKPPRGHVELYDFSVGLGMDFGDPIPFPGGLVGKHADGAQVIVVISYMSYLKVLGLRPVYEAALELRQTLWNLAGRRK
jgi:hypothetical protein